eukprot:m.14812 g.14812  ORF g.14812 m.14812 type:complete len:552 (+) comp6434_c0_seq2:162-1817(+)
MNKVCSITTSFHEDSAIVRGRSMSHFCVCMCLHVCSIDGLCSFRFRFAENWHGTSNNWNVLCAEELLKSVTDQVFVHPANPIPLVPVAQTFDWRCGVCGFYQQPVQAEGDYVDRRARYCPALSLADSFNVCGDCLKSAYNGWRVNQDSYARGDALFLPGFKLLGILDITEDWPELNDQEALLEIFDAAIKQGTISKKRSGYKHLVLANHMLYLLDDSKFFSHGVESHDLTNASRTIKLQDIQGISFLDDQPTNYTIVVTVADSGPQCFVFTSFTAEMGVVVVETFEGMVNYIYTEAVLAGLDDCIEAGAEGRETVEQELLRKSLEEEDQKKTEMMRRRRSTSSLYLGSDTESLILPRIAEQPLSPKHASQARVSRESSQERLLKRASVVDFFQVPEALDEVDEDDTAQTSSVIPMRTSTHSPASPLPPPPSLPPAPSLPPPPPLSAPTARQPAPLGLRARDIMNKRKSSTGELDVQAYMSTLQQVFSVEEMATFAQLLRSFRIQRDFESFITQLLELYEANEDLLPGLVAFLPSDDRPRFRTYLASRGLAS